ncbi:unnamed protein product [Cuscuta epithymum]|uniref:Uncharacterized protein n=1 Tax=Cuscuta epithymum TaxID=186058 RepID=A0AAV0EHS0_9ASTE|nr:unnamed protein product [Cuscuta epithymum]
MKGLRGCLNFLENHRKRICKKQAVDQRAKVSVVVKSINTRTHDDCLQQKHILPGSRLMDCRQHSLRGIDNQNKKA